MLIYAHLSGSPSTKLKLSTPSQPIPPPPPLKVEIIPIEPTAAFLKESEKVLLELRNHACAAPFMLPVDEAFAPLYSTIIKTPMDLSTVDKKMRTGYYRNDLESMYSDIRLIFSNCYLVSYCSIDSSQKLIFMYAV